MYDETFQVPVITDLFDENCLFNLYMRAQFKHWNGQVGEKSEIACERATLLFLGT